MTARDPLGQINVKWYVINKWSMIKCQNSILWFIHIILMTRNCDTIEIPLFNCREISFKSCGRSQPSKQASFQPSKQACIHIRWSEFYNYTRLPVTCWVSADSMTIFIVIIPKFLSKLYLIFEGIQKYIQSLLIISWYQPKMFRLFSFFCNVPCWTSDFNFHS